jgi:hypothetical protein
VKVVKTQAKDFLFGVRISRAMQIAREARMLIGAKKRIMVCRVLVVREQITPKIMRIAMERRTSWRAVLVVLLLMRWSYLKEVTYGEYAYEVPSNAECMLAVAKII